MSALNELTSGITHELNQPLNAMKIICQSIIRDIKTNRLDIENLDTELNDTVSQIDRLAGIIEHMRTYSDNTNNKSIQHTNINYVIENAFKLIYQRLINHDIIVEKYYSENLPDINIDSIGIEHAILNLISNARNAIEESGKEEKKIEISTKKKPNSIIIEIKDNGHGIPKENYDKIFDPFYTTHKKGTGMGLPITKKIIETQNGRLELESEKNIGTTFRIILPA